WAHRLSGEAAEVVAALHAGDPRTSATFDQVAAPEEQGGHAGEEERAPERNDQRDVAGTAVRAEPPARASRPAALDVAAELWATRSRVESRRPPDIESTTTKVQEVGAPPVWLGSSIWRPCSSR